MTTEDRTTDSAPETRSASLAGAIAIVVGNMIGVGVFTALGFQVTDLPSGFVILLLWLTGGLVAFCGAVCYAELVAMFPRSGGEYHLLRAALHPLPGFLAGWTSIVAGFPAPVALAGFAFGSYFSGSVIEANPTTLGIGLIIIVTAVHLVNVVLSSRFQSIATLGKGILILVLIIAGFSVGEPQPVRFLPSFATDWAMLGSGGFAIALMWVHYSYEGWNGAAYIAGEVRNPQRNVPIALLSGTAIVMLLYIGINAAFLYAAPMDALAGNPEVGLVAAQHIFGENGGKIMGALISLGLISAVSAMTWAGPRVSARMGEDYPLIGFLAKRSKLGAPIVATVVQSALAIVILVSARFEQILMYVEVMLLLSSTTTVASVIWLRIRRPELKRPYKAFGYPITPLLFVLITSYTLYWAAQRHPWESLTGILFLIGGGGVYAACVKHQRPQTARTVHPG
ncbi:MAG: APA family basic amino acid/polyamine antiporter [Verrucomicrobiales bacterium]|jgi:APA family basic amino acid/polyamine antiporter